MVLEAMVPIDAMAKIKTIQRSEAISMRTILFSFSAKDNRERLGGVDIK